VPLSILFANNYDTKNMSRATGLMSAISALGQTGAQLLGGWLYDVAGRWGGFGLAVVLAIIGTVLAFTIKEQPVAKQPMRIKEVLEVAANKQLIIASTMAIIVQGVLFAKAYSYTQVIAATLNAASWQLGILTTVVSMGNFFAALLSGQVLSKKLGERTCIILGFILHIVATIITPYAQNMWIILISQTLTGIAQGLVFPMLMSISVSSVPQERRTTAMGFYQAIYGLGMFAVPWLIGAINDWSGNVVVGFYCIALLSAIGLVMAIFMKKPKNVD